MTNHIRLLCLMGSAWLCNPPPAKGQSYKTEAWFTADRASWTVKAEWKPHVLNVERSTAVVHAPDDLRRVTLSFRMNADEADMAKRRGGTAADLAVRLDQGGDRIDDLAREAVKFFWSPRYIWDEKAGAYDRRTKDKPLAPQWGVKRFSLVEEPADKVAGEDVPKEGEAPLPNTYNARNHGRLVTHPDSMPAFVELLREIGSRGTGKVFWLIEPGQPPDHAVLAWQPDGRPCGGARIASPAWPEVYTLAAFEPHDEVLPTSSDRARTGLVPLPKGTWEILKQCGSGAVPAAIGKEGVVLQFGQGSGALYHVHLLTKPVGYSVVPIRTRGLAEPPPGWTEKFDLARFGTFQDFHKVRHLVGLAACSPEVWKKPRSTETTPPHHLRPLFADPELWACPPIR